ncbi:hypothetical protein [Niallia sp. FSL W8-0635]
MKNKERIVSYFPKKMKLLKLSLKNIVLVKEKCINTSCGGAE